MIAAAFYFMVLFVRWRADTSLWLQCDSHHVWTSMPRSLKELRDVVKKKFNVQHFDLLVKVLPNM